MAASTPITGDGLFTIADTLTKLAALSYPSGEVLFARATVCMLCIAAVAACDDNKHPLNGSITSALKPGMTEQQVAEVSNNRVPDRVVMTTCGTETPKPFACKVFVYEGALRAGQYDPKL